MSISIKVEKWYDVECDHCGRYLSTDFSTGMLSSTEEARFFAKGEGFCVIDGKTICPVCQHEMRVGIIKKDDL